MDEYVVQHGYNLAEEGYVVHPMLLHDAVGVNRKNDETTENKSPGA